jgi:hypothetical protein
LCNISLLFSGHDHAAQPAWPYNGPSNLKRADIIPFTRLLMGQVADWEAAASELRRKPISGKLVLWAQQQAAQQPRVAAPDTGASFIIADLAVEEAQFQ